MPEQHARRAEQGNNGWVIIGSLALISGFAKAMMYLVGQVANVGPSGATALLWIGVGVCGAFGAVAFGPVGRAIGRRILQGGASAAASDEDVQELRTQVEELRQALSESQDRIEFAERMLAAGKDAVREEVR